MSHRSQNCLSSAASSSPVLPELPFCRTFVLLLASRLIVTSRTSFFLSSGIFQVKTSSAGHATSATHRMWPAVSFLDESLMGLKVTSRIRSRTYARRCIERGVRVGSPFDVACPLSARFCTCIACVPRPTSAFSCCVLLSHTSLPAFGSCRHFRTD